MERIGYTRLYATSAGVVLVLLGLFGLLKSAEFDVPELYSELLGFYAVNGWANLLHIFVGLLGLVMARRLSRPFAMIAAVLFIGLGAWGILAPNSDLLFNKLPAERWVNLFNLILGFGALGCLVASVWGRFTKSVKERIEHRRTRHSRREQRRRAERRKQSQKLKSSS
ncbi:MAG: DUF4383 domain-containing protein [Solirubrobacterales bacterium]|nr:DUF4383 domain-containing protein [Solirubrobacterales bacterium]